MPAAAPSPAPALAPEHAEALARAAARTWGDDPADAVATLGREAAALDFELEHLRAGRAVAAVKPVADAREAAVLAGAFHAIGLAAREVASDDGLVVCVAIDEGNLAELARWQQTPGAIGRRRVVEAIGRLVGYPTCCIAAYSLQDSRGPRGADERATFRRQVRAVLDPLLHRVGRLRAISHHPCAPDCAASRALAQQTLALVRAKGFDAEAALLDTLRRPVLVLDDARFELHGEWIGDTYELERVVPIGAARPLPALAEADRIEPSAAGVSLVARDGTRHALPDPSPLLTAPGSALVPSAIEALLGGPPPPVALAPELPWLGLGVSSTEAGFTLTDLRMNHDAGQLELVFARSGRSLVAWVRAHVEGKPAFRKSEQIALGYVGRELQREDAALLETVWKRASADEAAVLESLERAKARPGGPEQPRHSRPAKWTGEGPPPPARLAVLGAGDVDRFFHVDYEWGDRTDVPTSRIGIIYRCNQWCTFCNLAEMDVKLPVEKVKGAIDRARARGSEALILTGGEPTLSPHLLDFVRYAKHERGFKNVCVQTNAVRIARSTLAAELRAAGLDKAQVSLHGPDAKISDFLTQAPGTHEKTLAGIDRLLEQGVEILVNHLIFRQNAHLLVDFVELARERWRAHANLVVLQFRSPKNEFNTREQALEYTAPYPSYARELVEAMRRARSAGFRTSHLLDPVGIPSLCVLETHGVDVYELVRRNDHPAHHAWESDWFTRLDACRECGVATACQGVRRDYAELFGTGEFHPLAPPPAR